uniref:sulfite exporter TauE/SafE family protein n=1 Tax=Pararhizobium sp. IMCC3301 TaxID=3067904 RepID=UPI0027416992|nr:sulfite exporter TauE/SafE family protein [Pararhizobium sp. IMCC3301]
MFDSITLVAIGAAFLLAGIVKGVIGLGLPIVSVALLTVVVGLPNAMALMLIPGLLANVWQGSIGGHGTRVVKRIWPFLMMATVSVWLGALGLSRVDLPLLSAFLGIVLIVYAVVNMAGLGFSISRSQDRWAGPLFGLVNGIVTGLTGTSAIPGVIYFQAIGLQRDAMIQAMGILFSLSIAALAVALGGNGLLNTELGLLSVAALVPSISGMMLGQRIRKSLSETRFRHVFFTALLLLGLYIILSAAPWSG